ncbi:SWIM zinc finger family protein [Curtobacterium sp. MCJR17_043]|uniref:SWIM zinc finger family protein n=1 Tax=Curtobacterium sp. MCJR17_043 TaxID=2175660 RepID=UPI0024DF4C82|nr:SWIM zinc finger family protein [Curtobacterium sp. MCJR17_043]WIB36969.1 SWIM zinc finger family protein [Curtobacterium sp. MCJR17_043]
MGPQTFGRARDVVRAGLVEDATWHDEDGSITATVSGSADDPYDVQVDTTIARGEFVRPVRSHCTCPLGGECKHVAAALLTINARALAAQAGPRTQAPTPPTPDWRRDLARLAGDDDDDPVGSGTVRAAGGMGLQFELRDAVPARLAGRARAAGRTLPVASRAVRLGVRPVSRSAAGNWVRGQLTWGALPYSMNRLGLEPEQHAWFMQFAALHRAGQLAGLPGESDWIHLDDFRSPLLWPLLRQAGPLGIAFVTGKREGGVELGTDGRVLLDAVRTADGLVIGASAVIDGRPVAEGAARVVGDHGVYAFRESPEFSVALAPTPSPVPEDQRRMLVEAARITVPADEVDEFLADWSPRLRGSLGLVSSDGSLELPERTPPELVLTVTFEPARAPRTDDRAHLQWRWSVDGRKDPVSLHGPLPDLGSVLAADEARATAPAADESDPATSGTSDDTAERSGPPVPDADHAEQTDAPRAPTRSRRRTRLVRGRDDRRRRRRRARHRAAARAASPRRPRRRAGRAGRLRAVERPTAHPRHDDAVGQARLVRPRDHRQRQRQGDPVHAAAPGARETGPAAQADRQLVPVARGSGLRPAQGGHRGGPRARGVGARPAAHRHAVPGRAVGGVRPARRRDRARRAVAGDRRAPARRDRARRPRGPGDRPRRAPALPA